MDPLWQDVQVIKSVSFGHVFSLLKVGSIFCNLQFRRFCYFVLQVTKLVHEIYHRVMETCTLCYRLNTLVCKNWFTHICFRYSFLADFK